MSFAIGGQVVVVVVFSNADPIRDNAGLKGLDGKEAHSNLLLGVSVKLGRRLSLALL